MKLYLTYEGQARSRPGIIKGSAIMTASKMPETDDEFAILRQQICERSGASDVVITFLQSLDNKMKSGDLKQSIIRVLCLGVAFAGGFVSSSSGQPEIGYIAIGIAAVLMFL